jgi:type IV secretion system protein VirD4
VTRRGERAGGGLLPLVLSMSMFGGTSVLVLPLAGQALAARASTGRWVWPHRPLQALPGLLQGRARVAVTGDGRLPSAGAVWAWTVALGVLLLALLGGFGWLLLAGGGRGGGYAGAGEARRIVGVRRLWAARRELRPDLYRGRLPRTRFDPYGCGVRIGRRNWRGGIGLWSRADRTIGVFGPQGCGKSLDILLPALLDCPGAALVTMTKPQDLLLVWAARAAGDRPVLVLDPFDLVPGLPRLVWDPVAGCVDTQVAVRRAKAFAAGTLRGSSGGGADDPAARFYAAEVVKVLAGFFHAAALTGRGLAELIGWVANPDSAGAAVEILRQHRMAEPYMADQLASALFNTDPRTAGNTLTTVHQAMEPFLQSAFRARFTPSEEDPASDVAEVIRRGGTIFLLGREDPYSSATPLMTAVAEHVIETGRHLAQTSPLHRLAPWMLCVLDELPSIAPIPSLPVSMANDRALGIGYLWASQTRRQLYAAYGRDAAESVIALSNNLLIFGGGKDPDFYRDMAELLGDTATAGSRRLDPDYAPVVQRGELRRLRPGRAVLIAEDARGIKARLHRCIKGRDGKRLLAQAKATAAAVDQTRARLHEDRTTEAVAWSDENRLTAGR